MATITIDKATVKAGETAVVSFTVEKTHTMGTLNRAVEYATVNGGTISGSYDFRWIPALDTATTQTYQGIFTPTPNLDRTECRVRYDPPGTANDATSDIFIVDTRAPTLTGTPTIGNPNLTRANQVTTISFVFHEQLDQASFTTADLTIPAGMGTLENLRTTDGGRSWQVDLRAPANLAANTDAKGLQIGINMAGITDVAGNPGTGNVNIVTYNIDNKPPSATIVVTPNPVTTSNDRLVTVTITFDEAVTGFTVANIDFNNAHVTRYGINPVGELNRSADGRTYTITYTAEPDTEDATNTISLRLLDTIRDAVNNAATVSPTSNNYEIDTKDPTPTSITIDKERLTAGDTATITITFNEIASGLTAAAIQIANGSVSNLTQDTTDGRIWTATFTPTANLDRTSFTRLAVNLDGLTDRVGNVSSGTYVRNNPTPIVIDTKVFVVNTATVNGKQLVLQYSDETMLDPEQAHNAPGDAFVVLVNGERNDVTGVTVDAAAKTVTLTLERAVSKGQQVTVAYNDPSTGNDQQAVQEAGTGTTSGKDAASFAAKPVTNLTPPPPPPRTGCAGLRPRQCAQRPGGPDPRPVAPRWLGRAGG
nr:Ig-like domain-containing protein [Verminephrobacter eiseniae]